MGIHPTEAEMLILKYMQHGEYLFTTKNGEKIGWEMFKVGRPVKKGTVERLLEFGLIRKCIVEYKDGSTRYLLTDEGRTFKNHK